VLNGLIGGAVLAVVGVALVDAVLGGNDHTNAASNGDDSRMQATLTDDGCSYRGDTTAEAGRFTIEVENKTDNVASFAFLRLAEGVTAATARPILAWESAWPELPGIFDYGRTAAVTEIGGGGRRELPGVGVPAGSYAVRCSVTRKGQLRIFNEHYVAALIEVTGVLPGVTTP
jgi:hypothetical protein